MIDTQGKVAGTTLYSPYGKLLQSQGVQANIAYAGLYHHQDTGLYLATYRGYNPFTARWLNRDPIEENGGFNLYEYVGGKPVTEVDLLGLDSLVASKGTLTHYNNSGEIVGTYSYTSGRDGVTDPSIPWKGPIPSGNYTLDPNQISEGGFLRNLRGDWGQYRAPLTPSRSTNTHGRSGFFLHGGEKPGSAGCIDIGNEDKTLFPKLMNHDGLISVTVE